MNFKDYEQIVKELLNWFVGIKLWSHCNTGIFSLTVLRLAMLLRVAVTEAWQKQLNTGV